MQTKATKVGKDKGLSFDGRVIHRALSEEGANQARIVKRINFITQEELKKIEQLRGLPMNVGTLE